MNEELLRKSLTDSGLSIEKVDEIIAAQHAGDASTKVPVELLQKSLDALRDTLAKPHEGLSEEQVQEEIKKAIADAVEPYDKHAKQMAATTDLVVKAIQAEMVDLRKSLVDMVGAVKAIVGGYEVVQKSLDANSAAVAEAGKQDLAATITEAIKKGLDAAAPLQPKSVQTLNVVAHPGDVPAKEEDVQKALTMADVQKALKEHPDHVISNRAAMKLYAGGARVDSASVLDEFGIKYQRAA